MIPHIAAKFEVLTGLFNDTLAIMDAQPAWLLSKDMGEEWNPNEILFHLAQSELGTYKYLSKKIQANPNEISKSGLAEKLRINLLKKALKNKRKFKAPPMIADMSACPDYEQLKKGMIENRANLEEILGKFDAEMAQRAYFKHPIAGRLNIDHTMDFLITHFARHANQIKTRIEAQTNG